MVCGLCGSGTGRKRTAASLNGCALRPESKAVNLDSYCRDIEAYLCRKNDGHLIRIAGAAFECVSRWAEQGIPFKVACLGIDRYFERYYRKGPRRRPVRIEFCEADVLDAFDDWRRAVGVPQGAAAEPARVRVSLASHVERCIVRLTTLRASAELTRPMDGALERTIRELDQLLPVAKNARGAARDAVLTALEALDRALIEAAREIADPGLRSEAEAEAHAQLNAFRDRMSREAYERSVAAAIERYIREHFGLPGLTFA